jgi:hypothetical protein
MQKNLSKEEKESRYARLSGAKQREMGGIGGI